MIGKAEFDYLKKTDHYRLKDLIDNGNINKLKHGHYKKV